MNKKKPVPHRRPRAEDLDTLAKEAAKPYAWFDAIKPDFEERYGNGRWVSVQAYVRDMEMFGGLPMTYQEIIDKGMTTRAKWFNFGSNAVYVSLKTYKEMSHPTAENYDKPSDKIGKKPDTLWQHVVGFLEEEVRTDGITGLKLNDNHRKNPKKVNDDKLRDRKVMKGLLGHVGDVSDVEVEIMQQDPLAAYEREQSMREKRASQ